MPLRETTLSEIAYLLELQREDEERMASISFDDFRDRSVYEKHRATLQRQLDSRRKDLEDALEFYSLFPQRHFGRHGQELESYYAAGEFEKNVFIMTKFPEAGKTGAKELCDVIECIRTAVDGRGYKARIASDAVHHSWLWDNVELNMLCCKYGVALLEDKCQPELNPNVAMEWGWMLGMGREVLMLREERFEHMRADWVGRLDKTFQWANHEEGIRRAIVEFLPDVT